MMTLKSLLATLTLSGVLAMTSAAVAADQPNAPAKPAAAKPKPYPLKTCAVTDEKLGDMGKPYVFTHEGRELKLCCKSCLKKFNKEPQKYVKKIEAAEKKKTAPAAAKPSADPHAGHNH
jgi:hypothetical protein